MSRAAHAGPELGRATGVVDAAERVRRRETSRRCARGELGEERVARVATDPPSEPVVARNVVAGVAGVCAEATGEPVERTGGHEHAGCRQRVDRRVEIQVLRRQVAEGGVQEHPAVARDHEIGVGGDLAGLHDEAIAVEGLAQVEIEDAQRGSRLPVAERHRDQAADQPLRRAAALPPVEVGVEPEAIPRAKPRQVDLEAEVEVAVHPHTGGVATGEVRPQASGVDEIGAEAVGDEQWPDPVPLARQVLPLEQRGLVASRCGGGRACAGGQHDEGGAQRCPARTPRGHPTARRRCPRP